MTTLTLWLLNLKNSDRNKKYVAGKNIADTSSKYCQNKADVILAVEVTTNREKLQTEKQIQDTNQYLFALILKSLRKIIKLKSIPLSDRIRLEIPNKFIC